MTLYREGHGPDEYDPADDDEIVEAARVITKRRLEAVWHGSDAPNVGDVLPSSSEAVLLPSAPGVAKTETTEPDDTKADDGGAPSALTKVQLDMIRDFFEEWPRETNPRIWALIAEVERLHPEWTSPPPDRLWRVNRTSTVFITAKDEEQAKRLACGWLGETVVMSATEADKVTNDD